MAVFSGHELMGSEEWEGGFHEFDTLIPKISDLLKLVKLEVSDIDRGVVCNGPGGFTSVRLGVSTMNALSFALDIPTALLSLFDLWEEQYKEVSDFVMVVVANKEEVFVKGVGSFASEFAEPKLMKSAEVIEIIETDSVVVGEGSFEIGFVKKEVPLVLPWDILDFGKQIIEPWYYKAPHIT